jgi:hypothetical protein
MAEPSDEEAFGKRIAASLARPLCGYLVPSIAKDVSTAHAIRSAISSFLFATIAHDANHLNEGPTSLVCLGNPPR